MKFVPHFVAPVGTFRTCKSREKIVLKPEAFHCLYQFFAHFKAGRKSYPSKPKKVEVFASPGAPLIKLKQSLEFGALEGGK